MHYSSALPAGAYSDVGVLDMNIAGYNGAI